MPKITDLAINAVPSDRPVAEPEPGRYWMSIFPPKPGSPKPPPPKPKPKPKPKNAGGLPDDAVTEMRQQLKQRVKRHPFN